MKANWISFLKTKLIYVFTGVVLTMVVLWEFQSHSVQAVTTTTPVAPESATNLDNAKTWIDYYQTTHTATVNANLWIDGNVLRTNFISKTDVDGAYVKKGLNGNTEVYLMYPKLKSGAVATDRYYTVSNSRSCVCLPCCGYTRAEMAPTTSIDARLAQTYLTAYDSNNSKPHYWISSAAMTNLLGQNYNKTASNGMYIIKAAKSATNTSTILAWASFNAADYYPVSSLSPVFIYELTTSLPQ